MKLQRQPDRHGNGHACPRCAGVGTVRVVGRPAYERVTCSACGGGGTLKAKR